MSRKEPNDPPPPGAVKPPAPPPPPLPHTHDHEFVSDHRVGDDPSVHRRACRICGAQQTIYVDVAPNDDRLDAFAAGLKERLAAHGWEFVGEEVDAYLAEFKGKR